MTRDPSIQSLGRPFGVGMHVKSFRGEVFGRNWQTDGLYIWSEWRGWETMRKSARKYL
jgi:hypothetical protein